MTIFTNPDTLQSVIKSENPCELVARLCNINNRTNETCDEILLKHILEGMGFTFSCNDVPWGKDSFKTCFEQVCSTLRNLEQIPDFNNKGFDIEVQPLSKYDYIHSVEVGGVRVEADDSDTNLPKENHIKACVKVASQNNWIHSKFGPISFWDTGNVEDVSNLLVSYQPFKQPLNWIFKDNANMWQMNYQFL
jgi:hypothetical protein